MINSPQNKPSKQKTVAKQLNAVIEQLSINDRFSHLVYVGKQYTKADLIKDLKQIVELQDFEY